MTKNIQIYGAGLSGLVSAINLAKKGYNVTVYEKEKQIGGSLKCHPSVHMTPMNIQKMQDYIGIELKTVFSKLESFRGHIDQKKYVFSKENLYVVERGPKESSLDYYLYDIALKNGVNFEFSNPLTPKKLIELPEHSIIATAGYSRIVKNLNHPYVTFKQFDVHKETDLKNCTIAYFGDYTSDYGYVSVKDRMLSAQLSGSLNISEKNLKKFIALVKETEGIKLDNGWSFIVSQFPKKARLFTRLNDKTYVLAGDVAGFLDPFFGFGITGALISGKIAAMGITSKEKALQEFERFSKSINKNLLLYTVYWHTPFKRFMSSQIFKLHDMNLSLIKGSIPGFVGEDWLKIVK